jgi:hypothetical protein
MRVNRFSGGEGRSFVFSASSSSRQGQGTADQPPGPERAGGEGDDRLRRIEKRLKKRLKVAELIVQNLQNQNLQNLAEVSARCDQAADLEARKPRTVLGALKRLITKDPKD